MNSPMFGLFIYENSPDGDANYGIFDNATFIKDFGPWKAGQKVPEIGVYFEECVICEIDTDDGSRKIEVPFAVVQRA